MENYCKKLDSFETMENKKFKSITGSSSITSKFILGRIIIYTSPY